MNIPSYNVLFWWLLSQQADKFAANCPLKLGRMCSDVCTLGNSMRHGTSGTQFISCSIWWLLKLADIFLYYFNVKRVTTTFVVFFYQFPWLFQKSVSNSELACHQLFYWRKYEQSQPSENLELTRNKYLVSLILNCIIVSELPIIEFGFLDPLGFSIWFITCRFFNGCLFSP